MPGGTRVIRFDADLQIEACLFHGLLQNFPNHFHEHYVIGCIDGGRRRVLCNNREYLAEAGDLILFNPRDNHACSQVGDELLNWRCLHVGEETMRRLIRQITGAEALPVFAPNIVPQSELVPLLRDLHAMVLEESVDFCKEELLFALLEQLLEEFAAPFTPPAPGRRCGRPRNPCGLHFSGRALCGADQSG